MTAAEAWHERPPVLRLAEDSDAMAIGALILSGLPRAPSAEIEPREMPLDAWTIGAEVLDGAFERGFVLVAELGGAVAGMVRVEPRSLRLASHAAEAGIMVAPLVRGLGVGRALMDGAVMAASAWGDIEKVVVRAAADDFALLGTLQRTGFKQERLERGGLCRDGVLVDIAVWWRRVPRSDDPE